MATGSIENIARRAEALANQIRNTTDCSVLAELIDQHLQEIKDVISDLIKEQLELLKNYLPIINLPFPDPASIVKWLAKLVTGTTYPQLQAYITMAREAIALARAITTVLAAVNDAQRNLQFCALEGFAGVTSNVNSLLSIQSQANSLITSTLAKVDNTQELMAEAMKIGGVSQLTTKFDISSPEAFLSTVDNVSAQISTDVKNFVASQSTAGSQGIIASRNPNPKGSAAYTNWNRKYGIV